MKFFLITLILLIALFLEATFMSLPFVLLTVLFFGVVFKEAWIFLVAFFSGVFLDVLTFHTIGQSSVFFIGMLGVMFLYQRKYEIQSIPFLIIFSFLASLLYGIIFQEQFILYSALFSAGIAGGIFFFLSHFNTRAFSASIKSI